MSEDIRAAGPSVGLTSAAVPTQPSGDVRTQPRRTRWLALVSRVAGTRPAGWFFLHVTTHVDRRLIPATGGRLSTAPGVPVLCLEVAGRRTGKTRRVPVVYQQSGDHLVLVASAAGRPRHPAWFLNVQSAGRVRVFAARGLGGYYEARVAEGAERERLWQQFVQMLPGFANYPKLVAGQRDIPVVVLTREHHGGADTCAGQGLG